MPPNLTPHESEALLIADKLDRQGDTIKSEVIRIRVDMVGIADDNDLRAVLSSCDFGESLIIGALRRVRASIAASDAGGA